MIHRTDEGGITVLRMEHGKVSALDTELLEALEARLDELDREGVPALVLTGTGSVFSAGVDLFRVLEGGEEYLAGFLPALTRGLHRLFTFPRPVVAAVNGHAIAGGAVLAAACDRRVMVREGAGIGVPELLVGVPFPTVALEVLRFATPSHQLQELVYRGHTHTPAEALARGLVDDLADPADLLPTCIEAARELAGLPADTFRLTKEHLRRPTVERIHTLAPILDGRVREIWAAPDVQAVIRAYLDRTLGKKG